MGRNRLVLTGTAESRERLTSAGLDVTRQLVHCRNAALGLAKHPRDFAHQMPRKIKQLSLTGIIGLLASIGAPSLALKRSNLLSSRVMSNLMKRRPAKPLPPRWQICWQKVVCRSPLCRLTLI